MCCAVSRNCFANISPSALSALLLLIPHQLSGSLPGLAKNEHAQWAAAPFLARGKRSHFGSIPRSLVSFGLGRARSAGRTNEHFSPLLIRHIWFAPPRSLEISSASRVLRRKQWIDSCRLQRQMAWKSRRPTGRHAGRQALPLARVG